MTRLSVIFLLVSVCLTGGCSAVSSYTPDITDDQRRSWSAMRADLDQRDFDRRPLSSNERKLIAGIFDTWRELPRMMWLRGQVVDIHGNPIPNVRVQKQYPRGNAWNTTYVYREAMLDESARFNWRGAKFGYTFFAQGYRTSNPMDFVYWPHRPPSNNEPLEDALRDPQTLRQIDDLVLGRTIVLHRLADTRILDPCHIELPLNQGPPATVFRYNWAARWEHQPANTPLPQRTAAYIHVDSSDIPHIGNQPLTVAQWGLLEAIPEQRWVEVLGPCMLVIADVDEQGRVARVESKNHTTFLRDEQGYKIHSIQADAGRGSRMRPLIWPKRVRILMLGQDNGIQPAKNVLPFHIERLHVIDQIFQAPEDGYRREIVLTHEDFEDWADQQNNHPAKAKVGSYFYVKLNGVYGNMIVDYPKSWGDGRIISGTNGLPIYGSHTSQLLLDLWLRPDGSRYLKEPTVRSGRVH